MQKSKCKSQNYKLKFKTFKILVVVLSFYFLPLSFVSAGDNGNPPPKIAFMRDRNIWVMDRDGRNQKQLTNTGKDYAPAWSPNRRKIAFVSERDGNKEIYIDGNYEIYVMDSDGKNQTNLTNNNVYDSSPTWSPDGRKIAFHSHRDDNCEIYVMDADGKPPHQNFGGGGKNQTRLTENNADDYSPTWSPDGKKIAFESDRDGNREIYVMDADGKNQTRLTENNAWDSFPAWSPDGKKIAFYSNRDGNDEIYVMDADGKPPHQNFGGGGKNQTRLTENNATDSSPTWSPNGKKIAFVSVRDGKYEIYVIDADGKNEKKLADGGSPSWSR